MSRVVVLGGHAGSLINLRGSFIAALVGAGHHVTAMADSATDEEVAIIRRLGAAFRPYPLQRNGLNPLYDVATLIALRHALSELQPDIVVAYMIKPIIWGGLALRTLPKIKMFALVTGLGYAFQGGGLFRRTLTHLVAQLYKLSLKNATAVVFQNQDDEALFVSRGITKSERCFVVAGSGVDLARFAESPLPSDGVVFLTIARLLGEKGLREYAEAARRTKAKHPDVLFWIVGPDDPSPDRIPLTEVLAWQESGWVVYRGGTTDVRPFLSACTIFVLPSHHEGMPRTVLEAMATGRPILTTNVPGCRATVIEGENGFLVPARDPVALAARMIWFVEHPESWRSMAKRSRTIAEQRFDVQDVNRDLLRILSLHGKSALG